MSKKSVLAGMLAIGLLAGVVVFYQSRKAKPTEADAIKLIRERGGRVEQTPGSPMITVEFHGPKFSDADLAALRGLKHLTKLSLEDAQVTDAGLVELKQFKELTSLNLRGTQVTDAGLRALVDLPQLNELKLSHLTDSKLHALAEIDLLHTWEGAKQEFLARRPANASEVGSLSLDSCGGVTDDGLKVLKKLPNLVWLSLSGTWVTDAGMQQVRDLKKLTSLSLRSTRVTSEGLRELRGLTQLTTLDLAEDQVTNESLEVLIEVGLLHALLQDRYRPETGRPRTTNDIRSLSLKNTRVTHSGLKWLKKLPKLATLDLRSTKLTDYGLEAVKDLKQLESLDLSHNTDVTDAGLRELRELKQLTKLSFFDTKVTDAGLSELQGLTQLRDLGVDRHVVTDKSLKCLADAGLVHALWLAHEYGFRPKNDAEVQSLNLEETRVTDVGVKELKNLKKIEILKLGPSQITDASLKTLTELGMLHALERTHLHGSNRPKNVDEIWTLSLSECDVTNASLKDLAALKKLRYLNLVRTQVTDAGLIEFPGLTQLSSLDVNPNVVTDRLLKHLAEAGRVHVLGIVNEQARPKSDAEVHSVNLYYTTVTHVGLKDLQRLKRLNNLALNEKQVTDDALKILAEIGLLHALNRAEAESGKRPKNVNEIRALNLQRCNVTDASLNVLGELQNLRSIDLRDTHITDSGLKTLRAALPDCEIVR